MFIYERMKKDWRAYCLMMGIAYVEEMSKPTSCIQIKKYKDKTYECTCFRSVRLKMRDEKVVKKLFDITKYWEAVKDVTLIGKSFKNVRKENYSGQDMFLLTPMWLNYLLVECGRVPNEYSFQAAKVRVNNMKQYQKVDFDEKRNLYDLLLEDKELAAGAFIISMDLEFRGIQNGRPSLCMSEKYRDFLSYMLKVARKWEWTNNSKLSSVNITSTINRGIKASPQFEFRISALGLREIYRLAGPLGNPIKDKCIRFHVNRSKDYINLGYGHNKNKSKEKILSALEKSNDLTTTDLQFVIGVGTDVVLDHLHKLYELGKVKKERRGKRYIWNIK